MYSNISLLDCTLRDGGYLNDWKFGFNFGRLLYQALTLARCEYVEIGFFNPLDINKNLYRNCTPELLVNFPTGGPKIVLLVNYSDQLQLSMFPPRSEFAVSMFRFATNKVDREKAANLASRVAELGYETTLNLMGISNYSKQEIQSLNVLFDETKERILYFYLADSFGSLIPSRTSEIFQEIRAKTDAKLGFHPHNNLQLAFANTLQAISAGVRIVDGSIFGIGRGGGNLNLESILVFLAQVSPGKYDPLPVLDFAEIIMEPIRKRLSWGYSLPNLISGALACHPNYPKELLKLKNYSAKEVFNFLKELKDDDRAEFSSLKATNLVFEHQIKMSRKFIPKISKSMKELVQSSGAKVLLVCGGNSIEKFHIQLAEFIKRTNCAIIAVNIVGSLLRPDGIFFGNSRRLTQFYHLVNGLEIILNPYLQVDSSMVIAESVITRIPIEAFLSSKDLGSFPSKLPTNSGVEAILSMSSIGFKNIFVAGMDGFTSNNCNISIDVLEDAPMEEEEIELINFTAKVELGIAEQILSKDLAKFRIITPTIFEAFYSSIEDICVES